MEDKKLNQVGIFHNIIVFPIAKERENLLSDNIT